MTKIHLVQCNRCVNKAPLEWNGEHWLTPDNWVELMDPLTVDVVGHLCPTCNPVTERPTRPARRKGKVKRGKA